MCCEVLIANMTWLMLGQQNLHHRHRNDDYSVSRVDDRH